jgi:hypothetical protein
MATDAPLPAQNMLKLVSKNNCTGLKFLFWNQQEQLHSKLQALQNTALQDLVMNSY